MASDDEDDYLSDKFLLEATAAAPSTSRAKPTTYSDKRREALRKAQLKNEQNRTKSRRERELEAREEGLSKSLFERAEEEQTSGGNKALAMMMKMGFKPGQTLGNLEDHGEEEKVKVEKEKEPSPAPVSAFASASRRSVSNTPTGDDRESKSVEPPEDKVRGHTKHLAEPLPLNEWAGRKGIGLGKRAASPTDLERLAKAAKVDEETSKESFRDRTRREFEQKRAENRLFPAQNTCVTLDEKAGKQFNVLWVNVNKPESFPEGLLEALADSSVNLVPSSDDSTIHERLRAQMQADALRPLLSERDGDGEPQAPLKVAPIDPDIVEEVACFLRLGPQERLGRVVEYLREEYSYCFWCGTQYDGAEEMDEQCPGPDEEQH